MDEQQILGRITDMADEEHALRDALTSGRIDSDNGHRRLGDIERELDQCGDLLRRRRAKAEFGENPDEARVRPVSQVENYQG